MERKREKRHIIIISWGKNGKKKWLEREIEHQIVKERDIRREIEKKG